jgi:hypothetical protein
MVEWQSEGAAQGIYAYRVEFRSASAGWTPFGCVQAEAFTGINISSNLVPHEGANRRYSSLLSGLPTGETYSIRIQVLDRSQRVIFTSPEATATTSCQRPSSPPVNIRLDTPDPSHVRITWSMPPADTWHCSDIQVELGVTEPRAAASGERLRFDAQQTQHVFESKPNERWSVRLRTVNNGGESEWSAPVNGQTSISGMYVRARHTRTLRTGELVVNVRVDIDANGVARLAWQSIEGVQDLVSHYMVEYSMDGRNWREHRQGKVGTHSCSSLIVRPYCSPLYTDQLS